MDIDWEKWLLAEGIPLHHAASLLVLVAPEATQPWRPFVLRPSKSYRDLGLRRAHELATAGMENPPVFTADMDVEYHVWSMAQTIALRRANDAVERVYDVALSSVRAGSLPVLANKCVLLPVFVEWARRKGLSVPAELAVLLPSASPGAQERMPLTSTKSLLDTPANELVRGWSSIGEYLKKRFGLARAPDPKTMKQWLGKAAWTKDRGTAVAEKRALDSLPTPPSLK